MSEQFRGGVERTNAAIVRNIYESQELKKEAMDNSTLFIRDRVRELGFGRSIYTPIYVTAADLDKIPNTDEPAIILEKDMDAKAYTMPFRGEGESKYWDGENFVLTFQKIMSDKLHKNKFEMMTSKTSYDKLLQKRIVEAMYQVEDETIMSAINNVIAQAEIEAPGTQYQEVTGGLNKTNIKILIQMLSRLRMIPTKPKSQKDKPKLLMTTTRKLELIDLGMIEIGDSNVGKNFNQGVSGINTLFGLPIVTTIKDDIVHNDEVYIIAPEEYSGRFMILQDHTLVIKTEADMIDFYSYAAMGFGLVNTKSVAKIKFV